jgi:hypothetical protein
MLTKSGSGTLINVDDLLPGVYQYTFAEKTSQMRAGKLVIKEVEV